jgi:ATP-dependent protease Clp ATPase subunit
MAWLEPASPSDAATLYAMLLDELRGYIRGIENDFTLQTIALLGVRHAAGHEHLRALIVGEPGTGKTRLVESLAEILAMPLARIPVAEMAETTWGGGSDLPDYIQALASRLGDRGIVAGRALAERAIVLIDDLDAAQLKPYATSYGTSERGQREGRQRSLLTLWQGGAIPIGDDGAWSWRSERALVIAAMEGNELPPGRLASVDLQRWGLLPNLAERMAMGAILRMHPVQGVELVQVIEQEAHRLSRPAYESFGYVLKIDPAASRYAVRSAEKLGGTRSAVGLLRAACDRALIELVAAAAAHGTVRVIGPDDVPPVPYRPLGNG